MAMRMSTVMPIGAVVMALLWRAKADDGCDESTDDEGSQGTNLLVAGILLCLSGLFSGLNLGLMSAAADDLQVIIEGSKDPNEVRHSTRLEGGRGWACHDQVDFLNTDITNLSHMSICCTSQESYSSATNIA